MYTSPAMLPASLPVWLMTAPAYEWPARTTGRPSALTKPVRYAASTPTPRSRFGGATTSSPAALSSAMTPFQLEVSTKAPWTSTTVRVMSDVLMRISRDIGATRSASAGGPERAVVSGGEVGRDLRLQRHERQHPSSVERRPGQCARRRVAGPGEAGPVRPHAGGERLLVGVERDRRVRLVEQIGEFCPVRRQAQTESQDVHRRVVVVELVGVGRDGARRSSGRPAGPGTRSSRPRRAG